MSSPKRRIETDVSPPGTGAHMSGCKVDILIIYLTRGVGYEVSCVCLDSTSGLLTLLQDVRRSYSRRQDNHLVEKPYLEG